MAQAYTIIGNRFRPFTYDELIKPVMAAEQTHRELEDTYADLSAKAGIWENLANEQADPKAYSMYKNYAESLDSLAGQLAKEGLSPTSRQDAIRMKQRYSTDIIPIEQAYTRRRQLADEQRQMRAKDPTIMYQRDANMMSLDDFLANPEADYGASYSGARLTKQVADAASNLRRKMRENPREWRDILGDQYYETKMQSGFTADEINQAIYDPEHADPILVNLMNSVLNSSGVLDWLDPSMRPQARGYAGQGLWNALGDTKYQTLANRDDDVRSSHGSGSSEIRKPSTLARIYLGASGEVNPDLKDLEGLRPLGDGNASTTRLDKLKSDLDKAKAELDGVDTSKIKHKIGELQNRATNPTYSQPYGSAYMQLGKYLSEHGGSQEEHDYVRAYRAYTKAQQAYDEELNKIRSLEEKYAHLGSTPYEALRIGTELANLQQKQINSKFPLTVKNSEYNDIRNGVANLLGVLSEEDIDRGAVGLVNSRGKTISAKKLNDILDNKDKIYVSVHDNGDSGIKLKLTYDNEDYIIKGEENIDRLNKELSVVNSYLKDFSSSILKSVAPINNEEYIDIMENGISNANIHTSYNVKPLEGTNYTETVLYNEDTGDYIKVIFGPNGNIMASNKLSSELSGGQERDAYIAAMAKAVLRDADELVAKKSE